MTKLNQEVSSIARKVVESQVPVQVTKHGKPVLRLVPVTPDMNDPVESLVALGLATPPMRTPQSWRNRKKVPLSRPLDDLLDESRSDATL